MNTNTEYGIQKLIQSKSIQNRIRNTDTEYGIRKPIQCSIRIRIQNTEYGVREVTQRTSLNTQYRIQNTESHPKHIIKYAIRNTEYGSSPKAHHEIRNSDYSTEYVRTPRAQPAVAWRCEYEITQYGTQCRMHNPRQYFTCISSV